ncbi:MAG: GNAT family N-acetyltransferase [Verrucomicrobiales bacterium]
MNDSFPERVRIRPAVSADVPRLIEMIRELAEFERLSDEVVATEEGFRECLFGESPVAEALVAENDDGPLGYAVFYPTFSTFGGRAGIWLEDLYVRPDCRRRGVGKQMLKAVGEIARKRNAGRYEWAVLDWNRDAMDLYRRIGGEILEEWRIVRLDREGIERLPRL